ncbi:MAG: ABC transporter ATP-binding protein [Pseudomonadota bacterium]
MLLQIKTLSRSFDDGGRRRAVLADLSFDLAERETVALWGPSGSGKSTLLNIVAGVLPAEDGQLCLRLPGADGQPAREYRYGQQSAEQTAWLRRRHLGYVFQFFNLIPTLTVAENIELSLKLAERPDLGAAARERAIELGLERRLSAFPDQLSGGEQQRAAIARALAPEPLLILADEPTGNLDAANATAVTQALWTQVRNTGCALLVATHDPRIAERADRRLDLT